MKNKTNSLQEYDKADAEKKEKRKKKIKTAIVTAIITLAVLVIYFLSLELSPLLYSILGINVFPIVICIYMIVLTLLVVVYIVYNRGFSRRGVTPEMLPDSWSDEKKEEFIENGKRRLNDSRWMLIFIVAFLVTFLVDAFNMFVLSRFFK